MASATPATDATALEGVDAESTYREVNDVELHVVEAGEADAPLVVLLHGFPEFWYGWHGVVGPLVEAGYRVLVPDQRGYNLSDKPSDVAAYAIPELSADVVDLVASAGRDSAHVVGHDWGAGVAWNVAMRYPETVDRLVVLNGPHPTVFRRTVRTNPRQLYRSRYVFYFLVPRIPEWSLARDDYRTLANGLRDGLGPETFTETDLDRYRAAWSRPGALTAMINWYRAAVRHNEAPPREEVAAPTLVVWGDGDDFLLAEMADESVDYCADGRLERLPDAAHWLHHEYPDRIADLLVGHLDS